MRWSRYPSYVQLSVGKLQLYPSYACCLITIFRDTLCDLDVLVFYLSIAQGSAECMSCYRIVRCVRILSHYQGTGWFYEKMAASSHHLIFIVFPPLLLFFYIASAEISAESLFLLSNWSPPPHALSITGQKYYLRYYILVVFTHLCALIQTAFPGQKPWLQHMSVRGNILCGEPFHQDRCVLWLGLRTPTYLEGHLPPLFFSQHLEVGGGGASAVMLSPILFGTF